MDELIVKRDGKEETSKKGYYLRRMKWMNVYLK